MVYRMFSILLMCLLVPEVNASPGEAPCAAHASGCCCLEEVVAQSCCAPPVARPAVSSCRECPCVLEPSPSVARILTDGAMPRPLQAVALYVWSSDLTFSPRAQPGLVTLVLPNDHGPPWRQGAMLQRWRC